MQKWKGASLFATLVMLVACWMSRYDPTIPLVEVGPVTLMMLAVTHVVMRAPYRRMNLWEAPLIALSVALSAFGAWSFDSEDEGFQFFFAAFMGLGVSYAFACTASPAGTRWRREVLEPTRRLGHYSLPLLDFGLVLAPFLFPLLAIRYFCRRNHD